MDSIQFLEWMEYFIQGTRTEEEGGPRERQLIILDGHKSHIILEVLELAKNNGIDMISLLSHSSHELQPLDKACFKPFKVALGHIGIYGTCKSIERNVKKKILPNGQVWHSKKLSQRRILLMDLGPL